MADNTKFCPECGKEVDANAVVCTGCGIQLKPVGFSSGKNRMVAALFALFLGTFGIQWFYLGKINCGMVSLFLFWTGIPAIASFIHFIILLVSSDEEFDAKYKKEQ